MIIVMAAFQSNLLVNFLNVNLIASDDTKLLFLGRWFPLDSDGRRIDGDYGHFLRIARNCRRGGNKTTRIRASAMKTRKHLHSEDSSQKKNNIEEKEKF